MRQPHQPSDHLLHGQIFVNDIVSPETLGWQDQAHGLSVRDSGVTLPFVLLEFLFLVFAGSNLFLFEFKYFNRLRSPH